MALTGFDKAIAAAILAAATALVVASQNGPLTFPADYIAAAVAGVITGLGVYFKRNLPVKA
jgi:hypothetical protein